MRDEEIAAMVGWLVHWFCFVCTAEDSRLGRLLVCGKLSIYRLRIILLTTLPFCKHPYVSACVNQVFVFTPSPLTPPNNSTSTSGHHPQQASKQASKTST
ncbi:hypothetical protein IWX46DRAFT_595707 [Phyllosticta citricarpa]|uniref:Secreted protein n=1 Tax=Phyllosticta citricarpa TaxID=55181 RepID=A0ABR1MH46_9PEZI